MLSEAAITLAIVYQQHEYIITTTKVLSERIDEQSLTFIHDIHTHTLRPTVIYSSFVSYCYHLILNSKRGVAVKIMSTI